MKAAKGMMAGGLAAAAAAGREPGCCPLAARGVPAPRPEQPGFRLALGSPQTIPTSFQARSHKVAETRLCLGGGY